MPEPKMTGPQFRALLDLWMVSDPWPVTDISVELGGYGDSNDLVTELLDGEARARGIDGVVTAYHQFVPDADEIVPDTLAVFDFTEAEREALGRLGATHRIFRPGAAASVRRESGLARLSWWGAGERVSWDLTNDRQWQ